MQSFLKGLLSAEFGENRPGNLGGSVGFAKLHGLNGSFGKTGFNGGFQATGGPETWFQFLTVSQPLQHHGRRQKHGCGVGLVGAGGIGQELMTSIRQFIYTDVSAIVLLLVCAVAIIDITCEKLRHRIIGKEFLV